MTADESTGPNLAPTVVDARRAAALVVHHGRRDAAGCNAIIAEVRAEDDSGAATTRLLFAVLELYQSVLPRLHTERGLGLLSAMVVDLARLDPT